MIGGVSVVIPIGPGHERYAEDCIESAFSARRPFGVDIDVVAVPDGDGKLGRSAARNLGASKAKYDWLFFIDADDIMDPDAIMALCDTLKKRPEIKALWGECWSQRGFPTKFSEEKPEHDRTFDSWETLQANGPYIGLCVGFFVHRDALDDVGGWYEAWDYSEDFELFYALIHSVPFAKIDGRRLVLIRRWLARASGPRGYRSDMTAKTPMMVDHYSIMWDIHRFWCARGPVPYTNEELGRKRRGCLWGNIQLTGHDRCVSLDEAARSSGSPLTAG